MKRLWIALALALFTVVPAVAQDKAPKESNTVPSVTLSSGQVAPTPEMWFYEQERQQALNPKLAIRRAAQRRAAQRDARLAAMKWFGFSNQRPVASPDPYNGSYSPGWAGNNSLYPYRWSGYGPSWVVLRPSRSAKK